MANRSCRLFPQMIICGIWLSLILVAGGATSIASAAPSVLATIRAFRAKRNEAGLKFRVTEAACWKRILQADQAEVSALNQLTRQAKVANNPGLLARTKIAEMLVATQYSCESADIPFSPYFCIQLLHKGYFPEIYRINKLRTNIADSAWKQMVKAGVIWHRSVLSLDHKEMLYLQNAVGGSLALLGILNRVTRRSVYESAINPRWSITRIEAAPGWQNPAGVFKGEKLLIIARGAWCGDTGDSINNTCGPDGLRGPGGHERFYLQGWLEAQDGIHFKIGSGVEITVPSSGSLFMEMNGTGLGNARGHLKVLVTNFPIILRPGNRAKKGKK